MPHHHYPIDYDGNWKAITVELIDDFLEFFLPEIHRDRDLSRSVVFLEQELQEILPLSERDKMVDKLLKVALLNGEESWILVHIEFQTTAEKDFTARMYRYYQLIRAKYNQDVCSFAIYTGKRKPRIFDQYQEKNYTTSILFKFKTYHIAKQNPDELLINPNPFAVIVLANYYVLQTTPYTQQRLDFKAYLYLFARSRGYAETKTANLLFFISELMRLTPQLDTQFKQHISPNTSINTDMFKFSKSTIDLVDAQAKAIYGTTVNEAKAEVQEAKAEVQEAKAEAQEAKTKLGKIATFLYTNMHLSIEAIAQQLGEEPTYVYELLRAAGAVK